MLLPLSFFKFDMMNMQQNEMTKLYVNIYTSIFCNDDALPIVRFEYESII